MRQLSKLGETGVTWALVLFLLHRGVKMVPLSQWILQNISDLYSIVVTKPKPKAQVSLCDLCNPSDFRRTEVTCSMAQQPPKLPCSSWCCSGVGLNLGAETCTRGVFLAGGGTCPCREDHVVCGGVCISCLNLRTSPAFLIPCLWALKISKTPKMVFRWYFSTSEGLKGWPKQSLCQS